MVGELVLFMSQFIGGYSAGRGGVADKFQLGVVDPHAGGAVDGAFDQLKGSGLACAHGFRLFFTVLK